MGMHHTQLGHYWPLGKETVTDVGVPARPPAQPPHVFD
jgi:hypothetical protein